MRIVFQKKRLKLIYKVLLNGQNKLKGQIRQNIRIEGNFSLKMHYMHKTSKPLFLLCQTVICKVSSQRRMAKWLFVRPKWLFSDLCSPTGVCPYFSGFLFFFQFRSNFWQSFEDNLTSTHFTKIVALPLGFPMPLDSPSNHLCNGSYTYSTKTCQDWNSVHKL